MYVHVFPPGLSFLFGLCDERCFHRVSSIESKSSHPMAAALIDYARSTSVEPNPDLVENFQNFPGEGVYGRIDGQDIYIGNKRLAQRAGCSTGLTTLPFSCLVCCVFFFSFSSI